MAQSSSLAKPPTDLKAVVDEEIKYAILPYLHLPSRRIDDQLTLLISYHSGNGTSVSRIL